MSGEGEGRWQHGRSGEAAPLPRVAGTPPLPHAAPQPAFYSPHHAGYQPWLPAQFSAMAGYGATAFYLPSPSPMPYAAPPSPGGDQRFLPLAGMVMGLPSEATTPRGWGGMQFEQQVAHAQPADYSRAERPRCGLPYIIVQALLVSFGTGHSEISKAGDSSFALCCVGGGCCVVFG